MALKLINAIKSTFAIILCSQKVQHSVQGSLMNPLDGEKSFIPLILFERRGVGEMSVCHSGSKPLARVSSNANRVSNR